MKLDKARAADLAAAGHRQAQIAQALGCSASTVMRWSRANAVLITPRPERLSPHQEAYRQQSVAAAQRGIPWRITFGDWMDVWLRSGHFGERGRMRGQYVMSRREDTGAYEKGNVFIQTNGDNIREGKSKKGRCQSVLTDGQEQEEFLRHEVNCAPAGVQQNGSFSIAGPVCASRCKDSS